MSARDLRNHTARVLDDIEDGTTVYITRNGKRVAMLTPLRTARHPANQRLLDMLASLGPGDPGAVQRYLDEKHERAEADHRRADWLYSSDPHPDGPDAHARRDRDHDHDPDRMT